MSNQAFNERCARAFGWHETQYGWQNGTSDTRFILALPDFASSPEWCWKAREELGGNYNRLYRRALDSIEWSDDPKADMRKATLLAFCDYRESLTPERTT